MQKSVAESLEHPTETVQQARIKLFLSQRSTLWVGQLSVATFSAFVFWWHGHTQAAILWCLAHYLLIFVRLKDIRKYRSQGFTNAEEINSWLQRLCIYSFISGCIWGSGSFLFLDFDNPAISIFVVCALLGIATGGLPALSTYFPAFVSFVMPISLSIGLSCFLQGGSYATFLAGLAIVNAIVYFFFGKNMAKATARSITMELDIADRYKKVVELKEFAEQASAEKSRFLAAISHDVSQPLYSSMLFLETLRQQIPSAQVNLVDKLEANLQSLHDMFNSMVELARLEQGTIERHESDFLLSGILKNLESEFRVVAEQKDLAFNIDNAADIFVHSDSVLLARILRNLISNAVKYTENGSVQIGVTTRVTSEGQQVSVFVEDTGCGISPEEQKQIFQEYWRTGTLVGQTIKGLGLGLSVVQRLVTLLQHDIEVKSIEGVGSTFTLILPGADPVNRNVSGQPYASDEVIDVAGLHILLLEDDDSVREGLTSLLESWGCLISQGHNVNTLLANAKPGRPPDLLISDFRLQDKQDGITATQIIRDVFDPQLPSLIVSGDFDESVIQRVRENDLGYLPKPVVPNKLRRLIAESV